MEGFLIYNIMETWKEIDGYDGLYEISNKGRVRSYNNKGYNKPDRRQEPKILKLHKQNSGYYFVTLYNSDSKNKQYTIHRLVAKAFIPNPEDKPMVNHVDGDKENNCVDNFEWVTRMENHIHAEQNGLAQPPPEARKGEDHEQSKLTEKEVIDIREYRESRGHFYGRRALADKYGVSEALITKIISREAWSHI